MKNNALPLIVGAGVIGLVVMQRRARTADAGIDARSAGLPPEVRNAPDESQPLPPELEDEIAAAVATADPRVMHALAAKLKKLGYPMSASSVETAARVSEAAQAGGKKTLPSLPSASVPEVMATPSAQTTVARTPYAPPKKVLREGSRGADVQALQLGLNRATGSTLTADGVYGPRTKTEVQHFQQSRNLKADGIWGLESAKQLAAESY